MEVAMYVGKSPIGNRSVSDLAIWGAAAVASCFVCVCGCVLMLAQRDKGGKGGGSGGQAKTKADPKL